MKICGYIYIIILWLWGMLKRGRVYDFSKNFTKF